MKLALHSTTLLGGLALGCQSAPSAPPPAPPPASAHDADAELAKQLSNPIAALISVPIQVNVDTGIGADDAERTTINFQPVVPFALDEEWNLITRTIVPLIDAEAPTSTDSDESGLGDILASQWLSPRKPTESGWIWGVGGAFLLPTASSEALGSEKWALGPTLIALRQEHGWTYGMLANHLWSVAGDDARAEVNSTFVQPFLTFTTHSKTTLALNTESTYDWTASQWSVPVNLQLSQLVRVGKLPLSLGVGYREYVDGPPGGPDWGLRFIVTFLFPK